MGEAKEQALNWGIDNAWDALEELLGKYGARGLFEVSRFMANRRFEAASIKVLFNDFLDLSKSSADQFVRSCAASKNAS